MLLALLSLLCSDIEEIFDDHPFELGMFCASLWDDDD